LAKSSYVRLLWKKRWSSIRKQGSRVL
jgi:hypothetical protein